MNIYLIRHGECEKVEEDVVLTKKGIRESSYLAAKLKELDTDFAFISSATRARQTFKEFEKKNPVEHKITDEITEVYRILVGGPERKDTSPERLKKDKKRINNFINKLLKLKNHNNVAIFTHGNVIRYFIKKILGIKESNLWNKLDIHNSSITTIDVGKDIKIKSINNIDHLPKKLKGKKF